ncbi:MAG: response regulator transcription factor [Mariprofundaceae bacterium]
MMGKEMIQVQLVGGNNLLFLLGLSKLLEQEKDINLLSLMRCAPDCHQCCHVPKCHVMVIDMSAGRSNSLDCIRQIVSRCDSINILILIEKSNFTQVKTALKYGAKGVLSVEANEKLFLRGIRVVADGGLFVDPCLAQAMVQANLHNIDNPFDLLSPRERIVLQLMLNGYNNGGCADKLNISKKTVANYFVSIKSKLDVQNSVQLTRLAIRHELIKA